MTLRRQFVHGLKWSALGKTLSQIVSWGITIMVIRLLSPADYGLLAMAMMVITLLNHLNDLGLGSALVQAKEIDDRQCGAIFGLLLILGASLSGLLALLAPLLAWFFEEPRLTLVLGVAGLGFLITALGTVPESLLRREMNFKALAVTDMANVLCGSLVTLVLAWQGFGVWALVLGNLAGMLMRVAVLQMQSARRVSPNLDFGACKSFLGFGGYLTASRFAWWFMSQADILIAAKLLGKEALGLYSVALNLASLPMDKAMSIINQVTFSAVSKIQDQNGAARKGILEGLGWLGYVVLPAVAGMAVTAPEFVPVILGQGWLGSILPIQLIALAIPLRMIIAILATSTMALGRADVNFRNTLTGTVIMPVCFLVGVQWGPEGLAASWLVAVPLVFLLNFPRTAMVTGISALDLLRVYAKPLAATACMSAAVYLLRQALLGQVNSLAILLMMIVTGAIVYAICLFAFDKNIRAKIRKHSF